MNKMIKMFLNKSDDELKTFGLLLAAVIPLLFGIILPWIFDRPYSNIPWFVGWGAACATMIRPRALKILYVPWMAIAEILNVVNRWVILSIIFYLILTPIALFMRVFTKRDVMERAFEKKLQSYKKYNDNRQINFTFPY